MIPVKGCVKNYHWGKLGDDNHIAAFQATAQQYFGLDEDKIDQANNNNQAPMAELWFGSHPSGPAQLFLANHLIRMDDFLRKEPEMVGLVDQYIKYNKQLPYLFKILSIAQPLSLQAHPDMKLAQYLHKKDPKNYPDDNHKPELAIALTEFRVLCDFRPHKEIVDFMDKLEQLRLIVGEENYRNYNHLVHDPARSASSSSVDSVSTSSSSLNSGQVNHKRASSGLAQCFKSLMTCPKETVIEATKNLLTSDKISVELRSLISELANLYPGDPGVLAPFFMNYLKLYPGQAVFLKANKLHAYISGECIECMACSDNVVRAGLTSKYRDVDTLLSMLNYKSVKGGQDLIIKECELSKGDCSIISYPIPTSDFRVDKITITNKSEYNLKSISSGSFIIILNGKAKTKDFFDLKQEHKLAFGFAGFIPPKIEPQLYNIQGTLIMYRAYC